ncbi:DUF2690 domain-containing protein [Streptomyces sp. NPDC058001]|uniref:DUF2690 domain-containing protein n=1 Tax=Streptomyces sp. NPDC058001 TaxID=3346300 RepID=UPI0036EFEC27
MMKVSQNSTKSRRLARFALVPAAAAVLTMIPLAGTASAVGCNGTGCENKGPVAMGCDADAHTVVVGEVYSTGGGRTDFELRWSNKCWAGWARTGDSKYAATISVEKWNPDRTVLITRRTVTIADGVHDWTNMVGGKGYMVRACATEKRSNKTSCTPFRGTDS